MDQYQYAKIWKLVTHGQTLRVVGELGKETKKNEEESESWVENVEKAEREGMV